MKHWKKKAGAFLLCLALLFSNQNLLFTFATEEEGTKIETMQNTSDVDCEKDPASKGAEKEEKEYQSGAEPGGSTEPGSIKDTGDTTGTGSTTDAGETTESGNTAKIEDATGAGDVAENDIIAGSEVGTDSEKEGLDEAGSELTAATESKTEEGLEDGSGTVAEKTEEVSEKSEATVAEKENDAMGSKIADLTQENIVEVGNMLKGFSVVAEVPAGAFDELVELKAEILNKEDSDVKDVLNTVSAVIKDEQLSIGGAFVVDISFENENGDKKKPLETVKVTIQVDHEDIGMVTGANCDMAVYHIAGEGDDMAAEKLKSGTIMLDENNKLVEICFETGSFSPFAAVSLIKMVTINDVPDAIYVSDGGDDEVGIGTQENPYATLAKAVEKAKDGATIYVMTDLTMIDTARYWDKSLTIASYGGTHTVTRAVGFNSVQDPERGGYNPAMIEVGGTDIGEKTASLRLENIVLDDNGLHEGNNFGQAQSVTQSTNYEIIQDSIVASYSGTADITLGDGAALKNFGGMSAVRITGGGTLMMEDGSKIYNDKEIQYPQISSKDKENYGKYEYTGPVGAVWCQGATIVMEKGSEISGMNGRGIYMDGGSLTMDGTIREMTYNENMHLSSGIAVHLRNKAEATMMGTIDDCTGKGFAVEVLDSILDMKEGAIIKNGTNGINISSSESVTISGEITNLTGGGHAIIMQGKGTPMNCVITETGNIHDNSCWYGTIYIQAPYGKLDIYGKINHNYSSDRAGAIALANNFSGHVVTMYDGAEMIGNTAAQTGGAVMVSCGTFIMEGGIISENRVTSSTSKDASGGGIFVRRGGNFIMKGGEITTNSTDCGEGGGIAFEASDAGGMTPYVELLGGTVSDNTHANGESNDIAILSTGSGKVDRYLKVTDGVMLGNEAIYFVTDEKTITAQSLPIDLENASTASITKLKTDSIDAGYENCIATFWAKNEVVTPVIINVSGVDEDEPVFLAAVETDRYGNPVDGAAVKFYKAEYDGVDISVRLPSTGTNGYAFALVQAVTQLDIRPNRITIEKKADKTSVSTGDTVTYTLITQVPDTLGDYVQPMVYALSLDPVPIQGGSFPVIIHDAMEKGLAYKADSLKIMVNGKTLEDGLFNVTTECEDGCIFEIEMDLIGILENGTYFTEDEISKKPEIIVNYKAEFIGTNAGSYTNTAWVEFSDGESDPAESSVTLPEIIGSDDMNEEDEKKSDDRSNEGDTSNVNVVSSVIAPTVATAPAIVNIPATDSVQNISATPNTGDDSAVALYVSLFVMSGAVLIAILQLKKRCWKRK